MSAPPVGIPVALPLANGTRVTSAERQAAILQLLEDAYLAIVNLVSALREARRREERAAIGDALMRFTDPDVVTVIQRSGFSTESREAMIDNVNALSRILARPRLRAEIVDALRSARALLQRAYEDLAARMTA